MTLPADPIWNALTSSMKAPAARQRHKDLDGAQHSILLVDRLIAGIPRQRQALHAAKETLDPAAIRGTAADLERTRALLLLAHDALQRGADLADAQQEAFFDAQARAVEAWGPLQEEVARARGQADQLIVASSGALAQLPRSAPSTSPDETRKRAQELAPIGLCDDPTMQSPDSHACPLVIPQREALREHVATEIQRIAENWADAAHMHHLKIRLKPLLQKGGLHPLLELLINVATGWIASRIGALVVGPKSIDVPAALSQTIAVVSLPSQGTKGPDITKPLTAVMKGLGTKLADVAANGSTISRSRVETLFAGIVETATMWGATAKNEVRQLPDPALVALGEALQQAPFNVGYFASKIEQLVDGFDVVEKMGVVEIGEWQPLQAVWVVVPDGRRRLALARAATTLMENRVPARSSEPGDEQYPQRNGKFHFHSWVDRSLTGIALSKETPSTLMTYNDMRWATQPVDPMKNHDVEMLVTEPRGDS